MPKMNFKVQILQTLRRLFIILVGLTMTWFDAQLDQKILDGIYVWVLKRKILDKKKYGGPWLCFVYTMKLPNLTDLQIIEAH